MGRGEQHRPPHSQQESSQVPRVARHCWGVDPGVPNSKALRYLPWLQAGPPLRSPLFWVTLHHPHAGGSQLSSDPRSAWRRVNSFLCSGSIGCLPCARHGFPPLSLCPSAPTLFPQRAAVFTPQGSPPASCSVYPPGLSPSKLQCLPPRAPLGLAQDLPVSASPTFSASTDVLLSLSAHSAGGFLCASLGMPGASPSPQDLEL